MNPGNERQALYCSTGVIDRRTAEKDCTVLIGQPKTIACVALRLSSRTAVRLRFFTITSLRTTDTPWRTPFDICCSPRSSAALLGLAVVTVLRTSDPTSTGFADAVAAAEPSVVNIYSKKAVHTRLHPICELPRYRELCDAANVPDRRPQNSLGSGVIVRSDGYILTNAHVIADADEILVSFSDEQKTSAQLIGTDPETDLAVIRANATGLRPIQMGSSDDARVGDIVLAIGNPFGIGQTVSMGIVSAKGRYGLSSPYDDFIQTDAAINPGNSGGALIDVEGPAARHQLALLQPDRRIAGTRLRRAGETRAVGARRDHRRWSRHSRLARHRHRSDPAARQRRTRDREGRARRTGREGGRDDRRHHRCDQRSTGRQCRGSSRDRSASPNPAAT